MRVAVDFVVTKDALVRQMERKVPTSGGVIACERESFAQMSQRIFAGDEPPWTHSVGLQIAPESAAGQLILQAFALLGYYPDNDRGNVPIEYEF